MDTTFSDDASGDTVQPCPQTLPEHWIEIRLLDSDGDPVPFEEYLITLTDGSNANGYLDEGGWARLAPLPAAGMCTVCFPRLDSRTWSYDHAEGPKSTQ